MKQVLQNMRSGELRLEEVPPPALQPSGILVRNQASLISAGTERMLLSLGKKSLLGKARARPDLVRKVLDKLQREGFQSTFATVRRKLDKEIPLGYSACGEVLAVGARAGDRFGVGDRVACAGAGHANHAEVNYVPKLLAVRLPPPVSVEAGAYATVGAIALQGIRHADVGLGATVAVIGLGLIGQLAVQLLAASGCRVVGLDLDERRLELARQGGAELTLSPRGGTWRQGIPAFTQGRGVDAVLITAATTSNKPLEMAAEMARDRARVVMVGVTGMQIPRSSYYAKELTFIVSRSYGPGRYDAQYEEQGHDYPAGYVRWTETRNMEAFLDMAATGRIQPELCTTHRFDIAEAEAAYEMILTQREPHLGVILTYPEAKQAEAPTFARSIQLKATSPSPVEGKVGISIWGTGEFARGVLVPALQRTGQVEFRGALSASGYSAQAFAQKFGASFATSEPQELLHDEGTQLALVATRHSQHAEHVRAVLSAGKDVFVEKPLALTLDELTEVIAAWHTSGKRLMVGFNRRFSPLVEKLRTEFQDRGPLMMHCRCNAGPVPADHWMADPREGGRILGEACHFLDLLGFLCGERPVSVVATASPDTGDPASDDVQITVRYEDGSVGHLLYTSRGPAGYSKESVEVFGGGYVGRLEDCRRLTLQGPTGRSRVHKSSGSDKGHAAEMSELVACLRDGRPFPIPSDELVDTTLVSLAAVESAGREETISLTDLRGELALAVQEKTSDT